MYLRAHLFLRLFVRLVVMIYNAKIGHGNRTLLIALRLTQLYHSKQDAVFMGESDNGVHLTDLFSLPKTKCAKQHHKNKDIPIPSLPCLARSLGV